MTDISTKVKSLEDWEQSGESIEKEFEFDDFTGALEFVNKVGEIAEDHGHHPNILLHDYNKVTIVTTTHDKGKLTEKDIKLAQDIDDI
jgi:4a-hydroxytetrahydrobiopterin dehydratase